MANSPFQSGHAHWIWVPGFDDAAEAGQFVLFRRAFRLLSVPSEDTLLHVSADTRYRLYLNGKSISFGPCKSYPTRWNYETVNITPYLVVGVNVIAARVLRFSSTSPGCLSMMRTAFPGFILHCNLPGQTLHTNETWKAIKDKSIRVLDESEWDYRLGPPFLNLNEKVDGRLATHGWLAASFDYTSWPWAVIKPVRRKMSPMLDPRRLFPREIPLLPEIPSRFDGVVVSSGPVSTGDWKAFVENGVPVTIPPGSTQTVDFESRVLTTGFLDLSCTFDGNNERPPAVDIICAECYEPAMDEAHSRAKGDRADFQTGQLYGPVDTFIPGKRFQHYEPFWFRTFRYIRLTVITKDSPLVINSFTYRSTHYPLDVRTTIQTSSPLITKLWTISINTLRNCMHETYEDCPFYEQDQFAMDARSQILFTYLLSRDDRLARKAMQEFHASRRDDGLVETHFPNPGRSINIPTFSLFWVLMVYDHALYFGDEKLVRKYIGAVDGVLNYFEERVNELGLVGSFDDDCWPFVDWVDEWVTAGKGFTGMAVPPAYYARGAATFHSLLYAYVLLKASDLCVFLGRYDTAREYLRRQQSLLRAVRRHCHDPATGFFLDGPGATNERSQHVQIFAVLAGGVGGVAASDLMRRTILQRERHGLAKASYAVSFYTFRAASEAGVYEECWPALIQPWEAMIAQNLTTWAESESMMRSDCHGWSGTPLYEIVTEILGVKPLCEEYVKKVGPGEVGEDSKFAPMVGLVADMSATVLVGGDGDVDDLVRISWGGEAGLEITTFSESREHIWQEQDSRGGYF